METEVDPIAMEGEHLPDEEPGFPLDKRVFTLKPGFAFNPFNKWPRNYPCFCGSGAKFKKCHQDKIAHAIPVDAAAQGKIIFERRLMEFEELIER